MSDLYRFGPFALDPRRRTLSHADSAVSLTPKAFDMLLVLVQNPNRLTDGFPNVLGCATLGDVSFVRVRVLRAGLSRLGARWVVPDATHTLR